MIEQSIQELIQYGIAKELVTEEDSIFLRNQLMDLLRLSSWEKTASLRIPTQHGICSTPASWDC